MNTEAKKQIEGTVVHTSQIAHVTFYITEVMKDFRYNLYSESDKLGLREHNKFGYSSYEEAAESLMEVQVELKQTLERKRKQIPTPAQLHFLFRENIPIPLTLTWGEASDIIDERLAQIEAEKQFRRAEKFKGFEVGMRVGWLIPKQGIMKKGEITNLTSNNKGKNYAYVKFDGDNYAFRLPVKVLQKIDDEGEGA